MPCDNAYKELLHSTTLMHKCHQKEDTQKESEQHDAMMQLYYLLIAQINNQVHLNLASVWNLSSNHGDGMTAVFAEKLNGSTVDLRS